MLKFLSVLIMTLYYSLSFAEVLHVDIFYSNQTDPINVKFKSNIDLMKKQQELFLRDFDAENDSQRQLFQIKQSLLRSGHLLLVNLVDSNTAQEVVNMAKQKGAYVLFFENKPRQFILNSYDNAYYIGNDDAGYHQGQLIVEYMQKYGSFDKNNDGIINIVLLKGPRTDMNSNIRSKSVLDYLTAVDFNYKVIDIIESKKTYEAGNDSINKLIQKNMLDDVELIICNNDNLALGALNALNHEGYNDNSSKYIPIFGIDAIAKAIAAVDYGDLSGTIDSNAKRLAYISIELLRDLQYNKKFTNIDGIRLSNDKCINVPFAAYSK